jgi:hypothetical protein
MKARIMNGVLTIEIPLQTPTPSKTGKTLIVASTGGFTVTTAEVDGKQVSINLNAFVAAK